MIIFLLIWPLLASLSLLVFNVKKAREVALVASVIELIISLVMASQFIKSADVQFSINQPWIDSLGINFSVGIDGISLLLVLLTTVLIPFIILSSFHKTNNKS